jgi:hypothetical protein
MVGTGMSRFDMFKDRDSKETCFAEAFTYITKTLQPCAWLRKKALSRR